MDVLCPNWFKYLNTISGSHVAVCLGNDGRLLKQPFLNLANLVVNTIGISSNSRKVLIAGRAVLIIL